MAYLLDDEEENQNSQQQPEGGQSQVPNGQGGVIPGSEAVAPQSEQQGGAGGGDYATLQKYIRQNQNQASGLADSISNRVSGAANEAKGLAQSQADAYRSQADSINPSFQASQLATQGFTPTYSNRGQLGQQLGQQFGAISNLQNETYSSPFEFNTSLQDARKKQAEAQSLADLTKDEGGRYDLLRDAFGQQSKGKYSQGQTKLDQALVALDPASRTKFSEARQSTQGFDPLVDSLRTQVDSIDETKRGQFEKNKADIKTNAQSALNQYLQMLEGTAGKINEVPFQTDLFTGNSADYGANSGLGYDPFSTYKNLVDPMDFVGQRDQVSAGEIADDRARSDLGMLSQIAGAQNPFSSTLFKDPSQIKAQLDQTGYENALASAMSQLQGALPSYGKTNQVQGPQGQTSDAFRTFNNQDILFSSLMKDLPAGTANYFDRTNMAKQILEKDIARRKELGLPYVSNYFDLPGLSYGVENLAPGIQSTQNTYQFGSPEVEKAFREKQKEYQDLVNRESPDAISNIFSTNDIALNAFGPSLNSYDAILDYYNSMPERTPNVRTVLPPLSGDKDFQWDLPSSPFTTMPGRVLPAGPVEDYSETNPQPVIEPGPDPMINQNYLDVVLGPTSMPRGEISPEERAAALDQEDMPFIDNSQNASNSMQPIGPSPITSMPRDISLEQFQAAAQEPALDNEALQAMIEEQVLQQQASGRGRGGPAMGYVRR